MTTKNEARPGVMQPVHDASITWRYIAPAGHTVTDVQRPDYFRNLVKECGQRRVAGQHAWNRIEVISEDGTWECELRVLSAADGLVQTRLLWEWKTPAKPGRKPTAPEGYEVQHIPSNGWRALDPHGEPVTTNQPIEDDAIRAAVVHAKKAKAEAA